MEVKVLTSFHDKYIYRVYEVGEVLTVTEERGEELLATGFVEKVVKKKPKKKG